MPFFWCVAVSCQDESWGRWEPPKARFALAFFLFFFTPVRSGTGAAARPAGTSGATSQPSAGAVAGRAEGFFLRARQEAAWGASRRRVLRRSPFFSRFLRRSRRPPPSKRRREAEFNSAKARFFPFVFPFFPLAWQDRARVELAVKARSSSLGRRPFFFLSGREAQRRGDPCLRGGGTGAGPRTGEGATLFFSGLGGTRKPVLQVDLMKEIASQARFPSFFSPLFGGVFWSGHTRGGPGGGLAGRESLDAGLPGPLPVVFPPPPLPSRWPSRSVGRSSASRLIRRSLKSIGFAFVPELRGAAFEAWPWPRTPSPSFSPFFFRSIPRRSVSPGRPSTSASTWKKRSGPRPFFLGGVFPAPSGHLGVPSGHLGVPSGHSAERALR